MFPTHHPNHFANSKKATKSKVCLTPNPLSLDIPTRLVVEQLDHSPPKAVMPWRINVLRCITVWCLVPSESLVLEVEVAKLELSIFT